MSDKSPDTNRTSIVAAVIGGGFTIVAALITGCLGLLGVMWAVGSANSVSPTKVSSFQNFTSTSAATIAPITNNISSPAPTDLFHSVPQPTGYEFYEDFEDGLSEQWEVQYGQLGMVDGKMTVISPSSGAQTYHYVILNDFYWKNVTVELELAPFDGIHMGCDANGAGGIILHHAVGQQSAGLMYCARYEGLQFGTFSEYGEWSLLSASFVSGWPNNFSFHDTWHTLKVVVSGNTYISYFDNRKITSASISGGEVGEVGLWFKTSAYDDVELFAPRIESIRITSNEP